MANVGEYGKIEIRDHFTGLPTGTMGTTRLQFGTQGWQYCCVNEGSFAMVEDEPGGVIQVTTDTADNDNFFACAGPFKPADGGCYMEVRLKMADITTGALYVGWSETLDASTPVMPLEFATATMTYGGTGGIAGMSFDSDGTTADWRAGFGDGGAVNSAADANGTRAYEAAVNDEYDVIRVYVGPDGHAECYLNGRLIKSVKSVVTTTDVGWMCLGIENRSAAASVLEVDYFLARGYVDWTV